VQETNEDRKNAEPVKQKSKNRRGGADIAAKVDNFAQKFILEDCEVDGQRLHYGISR